MDPHSRQPAGVRSWSHGHPDQPGSGNPAPRTKSRTESTGSEVAVFYSLDELRLLGARQTQWIGGEGSVPLGAVTVFAGNSGGLMHFEGQQATQPDCPAPHRDWQDHRRLAYGNPSVQRRRAVRRHMGSRHSSTRSDKGLLHRHGGSRRQREQCSRNQRNEVGMWQR